MFHVCPLCSHADLVEPAESATITYLLCEGCAEKVAGEIREMKQDEKKASGAQE